jgi:hypothetical protein
VVKEEGKLLLMEAYCFYIMLKWHPTGMIEHVLDEGQVNH